jgi:serine/threonine protein kinase
MALNAQKETLTSIGNCDLLDKISDKALGAVYKARNRATGEIVAVKVMPPFQAGKQLAFQRFARECRILSALNNPHIVRAIDFGIDGPNPFLVMEFVEGESLGQRLAREGKLAEAVAIRLISDVADALGRAHSQGLVHRNVKPDKILISADGITKLTDMGLVRQVEAQEGLTRAGTIVGTPNFMAPEQLCNASKATPHCDIYSLAATLYMAVTGVLPFGECSLADMWVRKLRNDLPPAKTLVPELSERIDRAIHRAMSTEPNHRPATCAEFVKDLTSGKRETQRVSVKPVEDRPQPAPAPVPDEHRSDEDSSVGKSVTPTVAHVTPADQDIRDGAGVSWLTSVAIILVVVAGFLSGLSLFAH